MFDSGANCFLNALVREFNPWKHCELPRSIYKTTGYTNGFSCEISQNQSLYLPLIADSSVGRRYFSSDAFIINTTNDDYQKLNFEQLLQILSENLQLFTDDTLGEPKSENLLKLLNRSTESQHNISKVLNYRQSDLTKLFHEPLQFIESEQSLLVGHSIHPCPKSRSGFDSDDEQTYVPEYGNEFQLSWFAVDKTLLYVFSGNELPIEHYCQELLNDDKELIELQQTIKPEHILIPCHPWQAQHWQTNPELEQHFRNKRIINLGQHGKAWRATSSLRSLYQADKPWMLKFSVSTQLTNSIRHLQPEEMIRGQVIEKVLASDVAQKMATELPNFSIMREPISIAFKGSNGNALDSTAIIWRQNPFFNASTNPNNKVSSDNSSTEVLSGLLQDLPNTADNRLSLRLKAYAKTNLMDRTQLAGNFLRKFLQVVIRPVIVAQAKYGLLFGAHQQNIVLTLDNDLMPVKSYFRDCQGTGFSALARKLYGQELLSDTADSANFFENDTVIYLFTYYLMVNSCFNTISSLTLSRLLTEEDALIIYQEFLQQLKSESLPDPRVVDYLLESEFIWSKGNFFCNLHAINENTMTDPFLIYHRIPNPIAGMSHTTTSAA